MQVVTHALRQPSPSTSRRSRDESTRMPCQRMTAPLSCTCKARLMIRSEPEPLISNVDLPIGKPAHPTCGYRASSPVRGSRRRRAGLGSKTRRTRSGHGVKSCLDGLFYRIVVVVKQRISLVVGKVMTICEAQHSTLFDVPNGIRVPVLPNMLEREAPLP